MRNGKLLVTLATALVCVTAANAQVYFYQRGGGYLGVEIRDVKPDDVGAFRLARESGAVVTRVVDGTPAAEAGLQVDDVIVEYLGTPIISVQQFTRLVSETPSGREVDLVVVRNGTRTALRTTVGERDEPGKFSIDHFRIPSPEQLQEPDQDWGEWLGNDFRFRLRDEGEPGRNVFIYSGRPKLGISGVSLTGQMADFLGAPGVEGILIMDVGDDTPAQRAGLGAGDVIAKVDGDEVASLNSLSGALESGEHELEIYRKGSAMTVRVEIEKAAKDRPHRRL